MTSLTQKSLNNFTYWEALYGSVTDDTPMIVTLHWMGGKPDEMQIIYEGVDYPLRAVFPQAPYPLEGGFTWYPDGDDFYNRDEAGQAPDIRHEADAVASFLWELKQRYPAKLAVTGMSQGGDLSLSLAVYHANLVDLAIPLAGRLSAPMRPIDPPKDKLPKIDMQQGVEDAIVSLESAREVRAWLKAAGFDAELREYPDKGHTISKEMVQRIQELMRVL